MHKVFRPGDFFVLISIILISFILLKKAPSQNAGSVKVQADTSVYEFSLSENGTYTVEGSEGETTIEILDGKVRIIDSACPNKTCVAQGWGDLIICLPNKVFVTVENADGEFDAVAE